jgi:hypothetical protein
MLVENPSHLIPNPVGIKYGISGQFEIYPLEIDSHALGQFVHCSPLVQKY